MPGTNAGTGQPIALKCGVCRRRRLRGANLIATGRTHPLNPPRRSARMMDVRVEYRCLDCGHVGWTRHVDAADLLRKVVDA